MVSTGIAGSRVAILFKKNKNIGGIKHILTHMLLARRV